ncbi:MAG: hypothetical protein ACJAY8_000121 [Sphingobacteriales bacterium]|jgi:hypothetical protein
MDLSGIITIAGKPGLFKIVARSKGGIIVESLLDGKRMPALSTHRVSALEDISIYTYSEDIPLAEVYSKMAKKLDCKEGPAAKSGETELRDFMKSIMPDYDEDRVYHSDLKKLMSWYNIMARNDLVFVAKPEEEEVPAVEEQPKAKKAPAKPKAAPKAKAEDKEDTAPKKKAPAKPKAAAKPKAEAKPKAAAKPKAVKKTAGDK